MGLSEDCKLEGDVNWIKNVFPEAVNFIKQELISEFLADLNEHGTSFGRIIKKWEKLR